MSRILSLTFLLAVLAVGGFLAWNTTTIAPSDWMASIPELEGIQTSEEGALHTVQLYYYDKNADTDETGNVMCSRDALVAVSRDIQADAPIRATLDLLLRGEITDEERTSGISTEYPLEGVVLSSVALQPDGVLRVAIEDPKHQLTGGSCRTAILAGQIVKTAMQFDAVTSVEFVPDTLFQP